MCGLLLCLLSAGTAVKDKDLYVPEVLDSC